VRRVLVVAYYFPPLGGIGSIRLARMTGHLPALGWEPVVLAPKGTPHERDETLSFPEEKVIRARSFELTRLGKVVPAAESRAPAGGGRSEGVISGRAREALRAAAHRLIYPDPQVGWLPEAVRAGRRALRAHRPDAIYSSSYPITAHLIARTLSRSAGLPWVAEFRDPWSTSLPPRPHRRRAERLERRIANEAARVVMPTPTWARHFGELWGRAVAVIPNGYDRRLQALAPPPRPVLTYLGTYYPRSQDLRGLWRELARMRDADPQVTPIVRFVGRLSESGRAEIQMAGVSDLVEETGLLPHDEAIGRLASSSVLIGADVAGSDPVALGRVPAKLFEYLASDVPILYLANRGSDAASMLMDQPGCHVVYGGNKGGVRKGLGAALQDSLQRREVERFSRRARAAALAATLDDALKSSRASRPLHR
jgi:glycosyltransferase involved in cell wall biosynthesis